MKRICFFLLLVFTIHSSHAQLLAPKPPMGWMTWNYFGERINENIIRAMADAMVSSGMAKAGFTYIMIDDGWQGGRDNRNHIIPDPEKFPSGIKALADYIHGRGLKLGIYSDAAQLTCAGYTASYGFEKMDAATFAQWGIDYLKYDYCNAPEDSNTAKIRYRAMADALRNCGRDIVFSICEWGVRQPWHWAKEAGGQLWRTTGDVRDSWQSVLQITDQNAELDAFAGPGHWNDPDMLIVGLGGNKGPSGEYGGTGCNITEYQSNMSLWCMMASPLVATNDIRSMSDSVKTILMNPEIIAVNQDEWGRQAVRKIHSSGMDVFVKPLINGDYALAILNRDEQVQEVSLDFTGLGLTGKFDIRDLWKHQSAGSGSAWSGKIQAHETKVFRLKKK